MSVATRSPKAEKPPEAGTASKSTKPAKPGKAAKAASTPKTLISVGGTPRADLLPPEVRAAYRGKAVVRMLLILVVTLALIVAGGVAYAAVRSMTSLSSLQRERDLSTELLARQLDFAEARQISNQVDDALEARTLATATEIDWNATLDEVRATLPAGVTLTTLAIAPVDPDEVNASGEPANPLQQEAVAAITITAFSPTVPDVEAWFDDLEQITGFAGIAPPATVTEGEAGESGAAGYVVGLELLLNEEAYLLRFQDEEGE